MIRVGLIVVWVLISGAVRADNWRQVLDLRGQWLFSIGDNMKWSQPAYNDREWETIRVPAKWEDEGFSGYNGFAWYRKTFDGTRLQDKSLSYSLFLGYVDDVDEVYVNGHKIGASGKFPPVTKHMSPGIACFAGRFLETIYRIFGIAAEPPITLFLAQQLSTAHWYDISAAKQDFGYKAEVSIEEGMKRLQLWVQKAYDQRIGG